MKKILLLFCKGTEIYEAGAFHDVIGWANDVGNFPIQMVTTSIKPEIICTFGLKVKTDVQLCNIIAKDFDALAIPGGFSDYGFYEDAYSDTVGHLIQQFNDEKKPIASICVGALAIGCSGVLKNRRATTFRLSGGERLKQLTRFGAEVMDAEMVTDENIVTSTSPATAMNVAFWLIEQLTDRDNTNRIRQQMGYPTD